jgi:hypothetical protein
MVIENTTKKQEAPNRSRGRDRRRPFNGDPVGRPIPDNLKLASRGSNLMYPLVIEVTQNFYSREAGQED